LPAFSLTEVLFNMILITMVIGCGYLAYEYAFSDMNMFDKTNSRMQEFVQFSNALTLDKEKSSQIIRNENQIIFKDQSASSRDVIYSITDNSVIRKLELSSDTFKLKIREAKSTFDEKEINSGLVEMIGLKIECEGKKFVLNLRKEYDSFTKIKYSEKNGN
jgi:hypothetical protein